MTMVLAIEDDPAILRGLSDNLRFEGYDVITATDGAGDSTSTDIDIKT